MHGLWVQVVATATLTVAPAEVDCVGGVAIVGPATTVQVKVTGAVVPCWSLAVIVAALLPTELTVPVTRPDEVTVRPAGNPVALQV